MPQYLSPGVYVEEIDSGAKPIEGVGTAVAAFIGLAEKGPFNQPTLCSNWTQFTKTFGGFIEGASLARSVFGFFQNGGGNSYVVRIGDGAGENGHGSHQQPAIEAAPQGLLGQSACGGAGPRCAARQHQGRDRRISPRRPRRSRGRPRPEAGGGARRARRRKRRPDITAEQGPTWSPWSKPLRKSSGWNTSQARPWKNFTPE